MSTETLPTSFDELLRTSSLPIFVDFWAEWCGPCHAVAPAVKKLAETFKGKLRVVKVNIDEKPQIASHYGIQSIPTMILFRNSEILWRVSGALQFEQLEREVRSRI